MFKRLKGLKVNQPMVSLYFPFISIPVSNLWYHICKVVWVIIFIASLVESRFLNYIQIKVQLVWALATILGPKLTWIIVMCYILFCYGINGKASFFLLKFLRHIELFNHAIFKSLRNVLNDYSEDNS